MYMYVCVHVLVHYVFTGEESGEGYKRAPGEETNGEECQAWIFRSKLRIHDCTGIIGRLAKCKEHDVHVCIYT